MPEGYEIGRELREAFPAGRRESIAARSSRSPSARGLRRSAHAHVVAPRGSSSTCPRTVRCTSTTSVARPRGNQRGTGATYCQVVAPFCVTRAERKRQRVEPCCSVMRA